MKDESNTKKDGTVKPSSAAGVIPPKQITMKYFEKMTRELNLSAFQITAAKILLQTNGRDSMIEYLKSIVKNKAI